MRCTFVVGARPNFMKVAPIIDAASRHREIECFLVHTGQHYDERMSGLFFEELGMPKPDVHLGIGSGTHASQTARVMTAFDEVLDMRDTDVVLVVGDVNSSLACALVASKREIPVAHVEAGLRSGDRGMPEEINRILTDQISDYLFTTERSADANLRAEGIAGDRIFFVGNVMIDTLLQHRRKAQASGILTRLNLKQKEYGVCTIHRPSNVDSKDSCANTLRALEVICRRMPVVFPIHPRTAFAFERYGLLECVKRLPGIRVIEPLGYLDFLSLMDQSRLVFTDSGGIQEETTVLGVPCLTFRENTERPVTIEEGTNLLTGTEPERLARVLDLVEFRAHAKNRVPELWDGRASERILSVLSDGHESSQLHSSMHLERLVSLASLG